MANIPTPGPTQSVTHIERQKMIILMIIGVVVIVTFAIALNNSATFSRLRSDLFVRWYATTKLFNEGRNIYDLRNADEMWKIAYGEKPPGYDTNFYYPAHLLIFIAPLALLPYQTAHLIWSIVIETFYFAGLWLGIRSSKWPTNSTAITIFMALNAISLPFIFHTIWGQFNTIGMIGLALCFIALCNKRYALAGIFAVSLTFKPQNDLLALVFLLFWALWQKKRWPFIVSFGIGIFFCWLFAEILQPGWVMAFVSSLGHYTPVQSPVGLFWDPGHIITIVLALCTLAVFFWKKGTEPASVGFIACLTLSMAVWDLIIPIFGWVHSVFLMLAVVWLVPLWKKYFPVYGNVPIYVCLFLFAFGWICFFLSFVFPNGNTLAWAETAYKGVFPLVVALFSIPLLWQKDSYD